MLNDFKALRFNSFTFRIVSTTLHPLIVEGIGQATCICTLLSKGWRETKGSGRYPHAGEPSGPEQVVIFGLLMTHFFRGRGFNLKRGVVRIFACFSGELL